MRNEVIFDRIGLTREEVALAAAGPHGRRKLFVQKRLDQPRPQCPWCRNPVGQCDRRKNVAAPENAG